MSQYEGPNRRLREAEMLATILQRVDRICLTLGVSDEKSALEAQLAFSNMKECYANKKRMMRQAQLVAVSTIVTAFFLALWAGFKALLGKAI